MSPKNTKHQPSFKAKVALAALREQETMAQLVRRFGVHSSQVYKWKKHLLDHAEVVFADQRKPDPFNDRDELLKKIGELTLERDFLARAPTR